MNQYVDAYPDGIQHHYWHLVRNAHILKMLKAIGYGPQNDTNTIKGLILDIGCGRGITVGALRTGQLDSIGVELGNPDPITTHVASALHLDCRYEALPKELRDQVTCVMLLDVIEHVEDDAGFLNKIPKYFNNLQHILITVPARKELFSNYDTYYGHYRRYDLEMLEKLGQKLGFSTLKASYAFRILYIAARLLHKLGKKRSTNISAPKTSWAHKVIARVFQLEFMLPKQLPGSSAIVLYSVER